MCRPTGPISGRGPSASPALRLGRTTPIAGWKQFCESAGSSASALDNDGESTPRVVFHMEEVRTARCRHDCRRRSDYLTGGGHHHSSECPQAGALVCLPVFSPGYRTVVTLERLTRARRSFYSRLPPGSQGTTRTRHARLADENLCKAGAAGNRQFAPSFRQLWQPCPTTRTIGARSMLVGNRRIAIAR